METMAPRVATSLFNSGMIIILPYILSVQVIWRMYLICSQDIAKGLKVSAVGEINEKYT